MIVLAIDALRILPALTLSMLLRSWLIFGLVRLLTGVLVVERGKDGEEPTSSGR